MSRKINFWDTLPVPGNPKVAIAVAAHKRPELLACLLLGIKTQTYENWEVNIIHDGPGGESCKAVVDGLEDSRFRFFQTPEQKGNWGHPWREFGISQCDGEYIGLTDDDNFYAPVYFEWMLSALVQTQSEFAHCDIIHSHMKYRFFATKPMRGSCDLGAWIAKASLVRGTPWTDFSHDGDGTFIESLVNKAIRVVHVPGCLMLHN